MNERKPLIILFIGFLMLPIVLYASIFDTSYNNYTGQELRKLAVEKGVIPAEPDKEYIRYILENKKTVCLWLLQPREQKISMINEVKKMFKDKQNVIIKKSTDYYVDEINGVLWNSFNGDEYFSNTKKGIGAIFRTIAVQEGDFDTQDGRSKMQILKDELGDKFEWYKRTYPEKFEALKGIGSRKK
jgi:hypothetical protein